MGMKVYEKYTEYGRFTVPQLGIPCLVILFSDHLTTMTWWHCLIFQLVTSHSTKKA